MKTTYVIRDGQAVPKDEAVPLNAAFTVIGDAMDAVQHSVTGVTTDSKWAFRRMTRDAGCVEYGNDRVRAPRIRPPDGLGQRIAQAMEMVSSRG